MDKYLDIIANMLRLNDEYFAKNEYNYVSLGDFDKKREFTYNLESEYIVDEETLKYPNWFIREFKIKCFTRKSYYEI